MGRMRSLKSDSPLDRISFLSDDVMSNILSHLPTPDVIRTSVLSKTWRNKWKLAPNIILNHSLISECYQLSGMATYILCHHKGPIEKFALCCNKVGSYCEIDLRLYFLSQKGIQDLHLRIVEGERHRMPPYIFSRQKLRTLELFNFLLKTPPTFLGFPNLVCLALTGVEVEQSVLERIIATSPLLKKLTLKEMGTIERLTIRAPNLKAFFFEGIIQHVCFLTPVLSELNIKFDRDEGLKITEFPPALDVLVLDSKFRKACTNLYFDFEPARAFWQSQKDTDLLLGKLSRVNIQDFHGESPELKFVQFILARPPSLEAMVIFLVNGFGYDDKVATREIMRFSRASSKAEVVYFPATDPE